MDRVEQVVGRSGEFLDCLEQASRAATLNRPVLVIGERGTGKELIASRLHRLSNRWSGPLVTMNCAALAETLIEAELFGHEAGAFTGATKARQGRFEEADGGTLFLDELATLSSGAQERLLRAVEYGEVTRVGANKAIRVDVRIVAATNEHLPKLVDEGRFRADLLDRLAFEVVTLPPLRAREGDVAVLADHFGRRMAAELEWDLWPGFTRDAEDRLLAYEWPGNIRELRNVVERAVYRWDLKNEPIGSIQFDPFASPWRPVGVSSPSPSGEGLGVGPIPPEPKQRDELIIPTPTPPLKGKGFKEAMAEHERQILENALQTARYNQRAAAKALSLTYDQLRHALKRHGLLEKSAA
jgi:psp operon transcriptional activator